MLNFIDKAYAYKDKKCNVFFSFNNQMKEI